jgi:hypothetical protein
MQPARQKGGREGYSVRVGGLLPGSPRVDAERRTCGNADEQASIPGRQTGGWLTLDGQGRKGRAWLKHATGQRGRQIGQVVVLSLGQD